MAEGTIKTKSREYAEARGLLFLNLRILGFRGWPDSIIFGPGARILFIEFKEYQKNPSKRKKPRKLQIYIHNLLKRFQFDVYVIDTIKEGIKTIDEYFPRQEEKKQRRKKSNKMES